MNNIINNVVWKCNVCHHEFTPKEKVDLRYGAAECPLCEEKDTYPKAFYAPSPEYKKSAS